MPGNVLPPQLGGPSQEKPAIGGGTPVPSGNGGAVSPMSPSSQGAGSDQLNTGTGGFQIVVDGLPDGLAHAMDVGNDDIPGINAYDPPRWSPGNVNVDKAPRDIGSQTKITLANYLSQTTLGQTPSAGSSRPNRYPVDSKTQRTLSLNDADSSTTELSRYSENDGVYNATLSAGTGRSGAATDVRLHLRRGSSKKSYSEDQDGNTLLRNATTTPEDKPEVDALGVIGSYAIGGKFQPAMGSNQVKLNSTIDAYYGSTDPSNISQSVIYNRFNPDVTFGGYTAQNLGKSADGKPTQSEKTGVEKLNVAAFASPKDYKLGVSLDPTAPRNLTYGKLAQVGNSLTAKANLKKHSTDVDYKPTSNDSAGWNLVPGTAQLEVQRVDQNTLDVRTILDELPAIEAITNDILVGEEIMKSWGSLNNPQDQFAGLTNVGMQLLSVALLVAFMVGLIPILVMFSIGSSSNDTATDNRSRHPMGSFRIDPAEGNDSLSFGSLITGKINFWRLMGIRSTRHSIDNCVATGALAFFGVPDPKTGVGTAIVDALKATLYVTQSPGYYAVMGRTITRSILIISDALKGINFNTVVGFEKFLSLIDVIKSSKLVRVLDVFSQLGDRVLTMPSDAFDQNHKGFGKRFASEFDTNVSNTEPAAAIRKSRLTSKAGPDVKSAVEPLAWSSYRAPDMLIMPRVLAAAAFASPGMNSPNHLIVKPVDPEQGLRQDVFWLKDENRINTQDREQMEAALEGEYVPFYIHDVRTNEIVSFHAFLTSLTDDYTASYDSVDGFGRAEPVKIYKNTSRKVGFSFYLVATSAEDFDVMWAKINKLTTLVYPQFSQGRMISKDGFAFHAPFSQTIQASPLVRVRIGDLIRSNYSKFNLARLFGYASPDTNFGGNDASKYPTPPTKDNAPSFSSVVASALGGLELVGKTFLTNAKLSQADLLNPGPVALDIKVFPENLELQLVSSKDGTSIVTVVVNAKVSENQAVASSLKDLYGEDTVKKSEWLIGRQFKLPTASLYPTSATSDALGLVIGQKIFETRVPDPSTQPPTPASQPTPAKPAPDATNSSPDGKSKTSFQGYVDAAHQWMDDGDPPPTGSERRGNAISRSFRSAGGKGLAGFIETMSFDWYDKVTWEIDPGKRAPKMCKVTVSFSPIHDITPGLDHNGANRAAIYPVGPYAMFK